MQPFRINVLFQNHVAWYDVESTDYKSFDLTLHAFKAYDIAAPAARIYMYKSEGKWIHNTKESQDFINDLGAMIEAGLRQQLL